MISRPCIECGSESRFESYSHLPVCERCQDKINSLPFSRMQEKIEKLWKKFVKMKEDSSYSNSLKGLQIRELIKKCLALSESPNENEAARAFEKAVELCNKYGFDLDEMREISNVV